MTPMGNSTKKVKTPLAMLIIPKNFIHPDASSKNAILLLLFNLKDELYLNTLLLKKENR
jgi:hypothetical protein